MRDNIRTHIQIFLAKHSIVDLIYLYAAFATTYVFPLLTIPFLSRTLGASSWGQVIIVQSFSQLVFVFTNFAPTLHGTRMIARHRDQPLLNAETHSTLLRARCALLIPCTIIYFSVWKLINIEASFNLAIIGFISACITTLNPGWILQGLGEMRRYSIYDIFARLISFLALFAFIKSSEDAYLAIAFPALASLFVTTVTYWRIKSLFPITLKGGKSIWHTYQSNAPLFGFMLSGSIINQSNSFVLSLFVSPHSVAIFSGAEKIVRAACSLVGPYTSSVHIKINALIDKAPSEAAALFRQSCYILTFSSLALSTLLYLKSDIIASSILGEQFEESADILRILSIFIAFNWLSNNINLNHMVTLHKDLALMLCVMIAALASIIGAFLLCPMYGIQGMAVAVTSSEIILLSALLICNFVRKSNPKTTATFHAR